MTENKKQPVSETSVDQSKKPRANEHGTVAVSAYFKIWDPVTKKTHVEGRA
jgi:hypothetical protein